MSLQYQAMTQEANTYKVIPYQQVAAIDRGGYKVWGAAVARWTAAFLTKHHRKYILFTTKTSCH